MVSEAIGVPVGELTGFEGQVTNEKMKKVLAHCDTLYLNHIYADKGGKPYAVRFSENKRDQPAPKGQCTFGTVEDSLKLSKDQFRPGDVATEYYVRTDGEASGHACMWTGKDWRSDFVQSSIMADKRYTGRDGNYSVCIWRHPDFQEPGQKVVEVT